MSDTKETPGNAKAGQDCRTPTSASDATPETPFGDGEETAERRDSHNRDAVTGRFRAGNSGGPGNPHAGRVAKLRAAMLAEVSPEDLAKIIRRLIEMAHEGDVRATKEVFDRILGKPIEMDIIDRLDRLESLLEEVKL